MPNQKQTPHPPLGLTARCSVRHVVDGDTLDIDVVVPLRIRLLDCWAPESRTKDISEKVLGMAAKRNLDDLTKGLTGVVFIPTSEAKSLADVLTLGRVLGRLWMDGEEEDVSSKQVAAGYASSRKTTELGQ